MSSRLDRLFLLLENGGSGVTRQAAAHQLGEVVQLHPQELDNLLNRLHLYIISKSWETRIAACQAARAIVKNGNWYSEIKNEVKDNFVQVDNKSNIKNVVNENLGHLSLHSFNVKKVLENGSYLFAGDESQFDVDDGNSNVDPLERSAQQRLLVNQRLGLDIAESIGIDTDNIFSNSDLASNFFEAKKINQSKVSASEIVETELNSVLFRTRSKRKACINRQISEPVETCDRNFGKKRRISIQNEVTELKSSLVLKNEHEWPFLIFSEHLTRNLFSSSWETRHGSATALREIISLQGKNAGKNKCLSLLQNEELNLKWLEDKAIRLVCVLALDRFGDFISDEVIAPVRETCAQALACIVKNLPNSAVMEILVLLQELLVWTNWGTRHGGFLGLKYILATRQDMGIEVLQKSIRYISNGISDDTDDVVAVAATCLVPVADNLLECISLNTVSNIVATLWQSLIDIDDLSASTNSILTLISKLLSYPQILDIFSNDFTQLVPRLWPFLYHSSSSVRFSTLKIVEVLLKNVSESKKSKLENTKNKKSMIFSLDAEINNLTVNEDTDFWLDSILESLLNHTYQRAILESNPKNLNIVISIWELVTENATLSNLIATSCHLFSFWLRLIMINCKIPLDSSILVLATHSNRHRSKKISSFESLGESLEKSSHVYYVGGVRDSVSKEEIEEKVVMARYTASQLLGHLSFYVCQPMPGIEYQAEESPTACYVRLLTSNLTSRSALQRYAAASVARHWSIKYPETICPSLLNSALLTCVMEPIYYDEITLIFTKLQQETKDLIAMLKHYGATFDESVVQQNKVFNLDQIKKICDSVVLSSSKLRKNVLETLDTMCKSVLKTVIQTSLDQIRLSTTVNAIAAGALVRFKCLPEKLNPVIKPLMESIKKEKVEQHQKISSGDLTLLLDLCINREPSPNAKIIKNLATFLCYDPDFTPPVTGNKKVLREQIIALTTQSNCVKEVVNSKNSNCTDSRKPGRPPLKSIPSTSTDFDIENTYAAYENVVLRRGCTLAITYFIQHFSTELESKLPSFVAMILDPIYEANNQITRGTHRSKITLEEAQSIVNWLQLVETAVSSLHEKYLQKLIPLLPAFVPWLCNEYSSVRHMSGRAIASMATTKYLKYPVLEYVLKNVVPLLELPNSDFSRCGALECIFLTIENLAFDIIPFVVLLIVPMLGRMSDSLEQVRHLASQCFATLIRLFPLDGFSGLPTTIDKNLVTRIATERTFLDQLLDPRKIENFQMPIPVNAELRPYQQKGINWLSFLNRFNLHGILCDDMGLGKTLQSICLLASDHFYKENREKNPVTEMPSNTSCGPMVQSLVVCPPTLTGHWYSEVLKFVPRQYLNPMHYNGPPSERKRLRMNFPRHNLIITSYKIVQNEIDFFSTINWNYVVLDEGHIIKNGNTKTSKAIKQLIGKHRLLLTGTPIQNNVVELWSLFDFLMPGFLGTEKQFIRKYSKPIVQSKEAKNGLEQEAGVLAIESLHRQVLPFLLRRVKEEVLKDLPPKITQDYYCELSPLQESLYEDFARSRSVKDINKPKTEQRNLPFDYSRAHLKATTKTEEKPKEHVFQALQYLRKVCNHPKLVLSPKHPQYETLLRKFQISKSNIDDISHSAKLPALKQLLIDCGIGSNDETNVVISPHRALIFCQLKVMLDLIEKDLFKIHLPKVSYLRLDGSVPAGLRHDLVQTFNTDPTIDVLLLTTHVGGLGLNLTGADTVIFVEHDWNPMRDLQAMDRAHRIGQKNVVNVYRLITKGTLEEKIMSLQKFKLMTANSIISPENSSLLSMGTDQLLDLFVLDSGGESTNSSEKNMPSCSSSDALGFQGLGVKKALESLPALWEHSAYEEEYDLDNFIKNLK